MIRYTLDTFIMTQRLEYILFFTQCCCDFVFLSVFIANSGYYVFIHFINFITWIGCNYVVDCFFKPLITLKWNCNELPGIYLLEFQWLQSIYYQVLKKTTINLDHIGCTFHCKWRRQRRWWQNDARACYLFRGIFFPLIYWNWRKWSMSLQLHLIPLYYRSLSSYY